MSSLEVHFDLLDLTELTDMSDQELAEVFADSDEENHNESPASKCGQANTRLLMKYDMPTPALLDTGGALRWTVSIGNIFNLCNLLNCDTNHHHICKMLECAIKDVMEF